MKKRLGSNGKQPDKNGFVLDVVMAENVMLPPMVPYWEDFKCKTIQYYLEKFTGVIGITLKMLQPRAPQRKR
jgi:hypothetical protein